MRYEASLFAAVPRTSREAAYRTARYRNCVPLVVGEVSLNPATDDVPRELLWLACSGPADVPPAVSRVMRQVARRLTTLLNLAREGRVGVARLRMPTGELLAADQRIPDPIERAFVQHAAAVRGSYADLAAARILLAAQLVEVGVHPPIYERGDRTAIDAAATALRDTGDAGLLFELLLERLSSV